MSTTSIVEVSDCTGVRQVSLLLRPMGDAAATKQHHAAWQEMRLPQRQRSLGQEMLQQLPRLQPQRVNDSDRILFCSSRCAVTVRVPLACPSSWRWRTAWWLPSPERSGHWHCRPWEQPPSSHVTSKCLQRPHEQLLQRECQIRQRKLATQTFEIFSRFIIISALEPRCSKFV